MQEYVLKVSQEDSNRRLDLLLLDFAKGRNLGLSRTRLQKLILEGKIILKDSPRLRAHQKVKAGDEIIIRIEDKSDEVLSGEDIPLEVIYEDKDLAVINKPAGLVVHPAPGNQKHTLVNALLNRFKDLSSINPERPGIVHRLDKETSGLLVIAKNNPAHLNLAQQFAEHSITRKYIAIVKGKMEFDENIIEASLVRHPLKRKSMAVGFGEDSKYAKTHYRTLKRSNDFSLLELSPFTGRTHQLRVHLNFIGHPILGDSKYGRSNEFSRLALHARLIGLVHPDTGKFMEFTSETPEELARFIESTFK
jgi:23S rRNA pseudouridine1911/1915/1917 synthase